MTDTSKTLPEEADFNWATDDSIAVREQPAIAVYLNSYSQVTLRRERSGDEEDDCFIPIAQENVLTIVRAILVAAGMEDLQLYSQRGMACRDIDWPEGPFSRREVAMMAMRPDIHWGKAIEDANAVGLFDERLATGSDEEPIAPKDRTAAERQRRHRANKRDNCDSQGVTAVTVTPSNRDTVTEEPELRLVAAE